MSCTILRLQGQLSQKTIQLDDQEQENHNIMVLVSSRFQDRQGRWGRSRTTVRTSRATRLLLCASTSQHDFFFGALAQHEAAAAGEGRQKNAEFLETVASPANVQQHLQATTSTSSSSSSNVAPPGSGVVQKQAEAGQVGLVTSTSGLSGGTSSPGAARGLGRRGKDELPQAQANRLPPVAGTNAQQATNAPQVTNAQQDTSSSSGGSCAATGSCDSSKPAVAPATSKPVGSSSTEDTTVAASGTTPSAGAETSSSKAATTPASSGNNAAGNNKQDSPASSTSTNGAKDANGAVEATSKGADGGEKNKASTGGEGETKKKKFTSPPLDPDYVGPRLPRDEDVLDLPEPNENGLITISTARAKTGGLEPIVLEPGEVPLWKAKLVLDALDQQRSWWESFYMLASGTGARTLNGHELQIRAGQGISVRQLQALRIEKAMVKRMNVQDLAVLGLLCVIYFVTLAFGFSIVYRMSKNNSAVKYYADPRSHPLVSDASNVDGMLSDFDIAPTKAQLLVVGWQKTPHVHRVFWRGGRWQPAFQFGLDISTFVEKSADISEFDFRQISKFLHVKSNDLSQLVIAKETKWAGLEELVAKIKKRIKGYGGFEHVLVEVKLQADDRVTIFKNRRWANFMHNRTTKTLFILSVFGIPFYYAYMWLRCRQTTVRSYYHVNNSADAFWELIESKLVPGTPDSFLSQSASPAPTASGSQSRTTTSTTTRSSSLNSVTGNGGGGYGSTAPTGVV
ncbi:unnamed protein product [Amoebophrya sp. A25]|nr:unnamed protein product [Amoebophrya sp. A25]|eukprot:GSA25T00002407001.1